MTELDIAGADAVGGGSLFSIYSVGTAIYRAASAIYGGINAGGATLRNYYGEEATLEMFAAGNLGA